MKLLTFVVPSYNSQDYLDHCVESLLAAGDEAVEVLIVNDGSKDRTGAMADDWARRFPTVVRALHQANGGHGEAVNTGVRNATGLYLKVVDSDDWVDLAAYRRLLEALGGFAGTERPVDLVVSNYVYEKAGAPKKKVMDYRKVLPRGRVFGWDEVRPFRLGQYLTMHSLTYRTQVLRDSGLVLPAHTFYVDNLFAYVPLDHVRTLSYLDADFYRYFIGRDDQSVNEAVMIKRIDQQLKVNWLVVSHQKLDQVVPPRLRELKFHQLEIVTAISNILLIRAGTPEADRKRSELWASLREWDEGLYRRLRRGLLGRLAHLPGKPGRKLAVGIYQVTQKLFGFN